MSGVSCMELLRMVMRGATRQTIVLALAWRVLLLSDRSCLALLLAFGASYRIIPCHLMVMSIDAHMYYVYI